MRPAISFPASRLCPGLVVGLVALLCWGCHDAPRSNPFDPALTPPVILQVALDDTAGTATLTWSRYEGKQPFAEYRVLRNIADRKTVDTLAHLPTVAQTTFVDTTLTPSTAYVYRVETLNTGGYAAASEEKGVAGFRVGAVKLLPVEPDPRAGTLSLRWNRYVGPDFAGYQVFRRVGETLQEELLATAGQVQDTTLADSTARADVGYVYRVMVLAAGGELPSNTVEARLLLPPVLLSTPQFDSHTASASLTWTRYQGPRFRAYRVERRSEGLAPRALEEIVDPADTLLVDTGLLGNTEYLYRVVVETTRDEAVAGEEKAGIFHELAGSWPLPIEEGEYVRLYREGGIITALVSAPSRVRLLSFDPQGTLLGEQVLLNVSFLELEPQSVAMAPAAEAGEHWLSLLVHQDPSTTQTGLGDRTVLLRFDRDGHPVWQEQEVFADSLPVFTGPQAVVENEAVLVWSDIESALMDNVQITNGDRVVYAEDFEDADLAPWEIPSFERTHVRAGWLSGYGIMTYRWDNPWQEIDFQAEIALYSSNDNYIISGYGGIRLGSGLRSGYIQAARNSSFTFTLNHGRQLAALAWRFIPPEPGGKVQDRYFEQHRPLFIGLPYRLKLHYGAGKVRAYVGDPVWWSTPPEGQSGYSSLVRLEDKLALTSGAQPYLQNPTRKDSLSEALRSPASETRLWLNQRGQPRIGICLPQSNLVAIGLSGTYFGTKQLIWPFARNLAGLPFPPLGFAGDQGGELSWPLSFDASPDGRFYVLSAGNAHISVFGDQGQYLTQWGAKGKGEGQFDFGGRAGAESFMGSLVVDNEGYIYVADVGNKRIQKFEP